MDGVKLDTIAYTVNGESRALAPLIVGNKTIDKEDMPASRPKCMPQGGSLKKTDRSTPLRASRFSPVCADKLVVIVSGRVDARRSGCGGAEIGWRFLCVIQGRKIFR